MRKIILTACLTSLLILPGVTFGDPPWANNDGYEHEHGHRHHRERYSEEADRGGPPPWAPAHGYRRQHDSDYDREEHHEERRQAAEVDFGIAQGTCDRAEIGTILGGAVGAAIGAKIGSRDDKVLSMVTGTIIGALAGRSIGRQMDQADQACTGQVLERASDRQSVAWVNRQTGVNYKVTPIATYKRNGQYCRDYMTYTEIEGRHQSTKGTACRNNDGIWRMNKKS